MLPPPNPPASGTATSSTNTSTNANHTNHSFGSGSSGAGAGAPFSSAGTSGSLPTRPSLAARSAASSASTSTQTSYNSNYSSSPSVGGSRGSSTALHPPSTPGQWAPSLSGGGSTSDGRWTGSAGFSAPVGSNGEADPSAPAAGPSRGRGDDQRMLSRTEEGFGRVIQLSGGTFAGKAMRFSLTMEQQPIHGRRKTEKDRRPLAHCPILRLKMLECVQRADGSGIIDEEEIDVVTLEPGNFVCAAELFDVVSAPAPVTDQTHGPSRPDPPRYSASVRGTPAPRRRNSTSEDAGGDTDVQPESSPPRAGRLYRASSWAADGPPGITGHVVQTHYIKGASLDRAGPGNAPPSGSSSATATPAHPEGHADFVDPDDDDLELDTPGARTSESIRAGHARTAGDRSSGSSGSGDSITAQPQPKRARHPDGSSSSTPAAHKLDHVVPRNLYGSLHVPAVRVIAPESDFGLWFLFTEGTYALKFRVFDITAASRTSSAPMLVETNSQAFKVYSPRNFPGLPKPTFLAEHFGRQGFKLNTRKNERQAKSPPTSPPERPAPTPIQSHENTPVGSGHSERDAKAAPDRSRSPGRPGTGNTVSTMGATSATSGSGSAGSSMSGSGRGRGVAPSPLSKSFGKR